MISGVRRLIGIALVFLSINQALIYLSLPSRHIDVIDAPSTITSPFKERVPESNIATVAYVITITECESTVLDGAAVLAESIAATQQPLYKLIAFVYNEGLAPSCQQGLEFLGFQVLFKGLPFDVKNLKYHTRNRIKQGGCCQEKEYLKLYTFQLVDFDIVVHLDIDVLLLKSLDPLIDVALKGSDSHVSIRTIPANDVLPQKVDFMFVREYNTYNPNFPTNRFKNGIQGAFFLARPSQERFDDMLRVLHNADFDRVLGWDSLGYGGYWGHAQIQGFLSYFYVVADNLTTAVELDPCRYNTLGHNLRYLREPNLTSTCRTSEATCEDCSATPWEEIYVAHLSLCKKPWWCPNRLIRESVPLCARFYAKWFEIRKQVDQKLFGASVQITDNEYSQKSLGYCTGMGKAAYRPVQRSVFVVNVSKSSIV